MQFTRWQQLLESLDYPLVFADLETTSSNVDRARIVEAGCVMYGPPRLVQKDMSMMNLALSAERAPGMARMWRIRCNPGADVLQFPEYLRSVRIHRLDAKTLRGCSTFTKQAEHLMHQLDAGYVLGFNSEHYDMPVIVKHLEAEGYELDPATRTSIDVWRILAHVAEAATPPVTSLRVLDAIAGVPLVMYASEGLAAFKRNLGTMHEALLGVPANKMLQHGSLYDCIMTANVLAAAMELWPELVPATIAELQRASKVAPRNWVDWEHFLHYDEETKEWLFTRGEHRGLALQEAPIGYLHWMIDKATFEPDTRQVVNYYLRMRKHLYPGLCGTRVRNALRMSSAGSDDIFS
jgi:DNA polymerase III epsilon subunit-like protein